MRKNKNLSSSEFIETDFICNSDKYTDIKPLPANGFNTLYKAKRYGKWFILKGLKPKYKQNTIYRNLLMKEFELGINLDHQNIVNIIDKENINNIGTCIVMEYIDGCNLNDFLNTKPSKKIRKKILLEIIDALQYIHSKQLTHRDLKPSNIIITYNGKNAKLIDFGLSDSDYYASFKQPAGTLKYAAPEQLDINTKIDCRADIYSLGHIICLMFKTKYRNIAIKCKQKERNNRYNNANDVKNAIIKNDNKWKIIFTILFIILLLIALTSERITSHKQLETVNQTQQKVIHMILELNNKENNIQYNRKNYFLINRESYKHENKKQIITKNLIK